MVKVKLDIRASIPYRIGRKVESETMSKVISYLLNNREIIEAVSLLGDLELGNSRPSYLSFMLLNKLLSITVCKIITYYEQLETVPQRCINL